MKSVFKNNETKQQQQQQQKKEKKNTMNCNDNISFFCQSTYRYHRK